MKKFLTIVCLIIAAISFTACDKEPIFTPQPVQPVQTTVPEPIKITADDWTKFAYPEWINPETNDTAYYELVCEKIVPQPVLSIGKKAESRRNDSRIVDTNNHLYSNFYGIGALQVTIYNIHYIIGDSVVVGDSDDRVIRVSWNTFQEDSVWRFVIRTGKIDGGFGGFYGPEEEYVIEDFYIKFD